MSMHAPSSVAGHSDPGLERAIADEVDATLDAWRSKAVGIVLAVASLVMLPAGAAVLSNRIFQLALPLLVVSVLLLLLVVLAAFRPRWKLQGRAAILLGALACFAFFQLVVTQLTGSGRLTLVSMPLVALVLVGTRTGWMMAGLSIVLYAAVAFLDQTGLLAAWHIADGSAPSTAYWALQGVRLGGGILMLLTLLTQFQSLQRRTMIAERSALRRLEAETAARRRVEKEVAQVSERERRRLGAELHDGLCQHLTATLLNCSALENRLMATGSPDLPGVRQIRESMEESIDRAYDAAHGLCPLDLGPTGLVPALERLCLGIQERDGIRCQFQADPGLTVANPETALHLYRIAGEAAANAVKHARGSQVVVHLVRENGEIVLTVSDDGCGAPLDAADEGKGMGRRIMAYRATLMGGTLAVSSTPGRGTTVTCRVPDREGHG